MEPSQEASVTSSNESAPRSSSPTSSSTSTAAAAAIKTPVSLLQELYVKRGITPKYDLVQIEGAVHEPTFKYRVTVGDFVATGCGQSKKKAKHTAAKSMLDKIRRHAQQHLKSVTAAGGGGEEGGVVAKKMPIMDVPPDVTELASPYDDGIEGNPVGDLQEICMNRRMQPPVYEVSLEEGQPHERKFVIVCKVGKHAESGSGKSKKLAKRLSAHKMLQTLQNHPLDGDGMGGPEGEAASASILDIDEDDLVQGMAQQRAKEVREGKPFTNANLSLFYRNLKVAAGTALAAIQEKGTDELKADGERVLQEIATEQCFTVTYVDIEEKSTTDKFHTIVQISTVPVAVCYGVGDTEQESKADAAFNGCMYLKLMTHNPRAKKPDGSEGASTNGKNIH